MMTVSRALEVAQTIKSYFDPQALPEFHEAIDVLSRNAAAHVDTQVEYHDAGLMRTEDG